MPDKDKEMLKKAEDCPRPGGKPCPTCQSFEPCAHDKPWPKEKAGNVKQGDAGTAEWWKSVEKCGDRPHTPIVSESQRGLFGAELARRRKGEAPQMKGITTEELEGHLHEAGGKSLSKMIVIQELVKTAGIPAGWQGKGANCPNCGQVVQQKHPMQTLERQMHNHLRTHVKKASDDVIDAEKRKIARTNPHGVYWSGKQGEDPGARLRQLIQQRMSMKNDLDKAEDGETEMPPFPGRDDKEASKRLHDEMRNSPQRYPHIYGPMAASKVEKSLVIRDLILAADKPNEAKEHAEWKRKNPAEAAHIAAIMQKMIDLAKERGEHPSDWEQTWEAKPDADPGDTPKQQLHCPNCGSVNEGEKLQHGDKMHVLQTCSRGACLNAPKGASMHYSYKPDEG